MTSVISFYHVKGELERLVDYEDRDEGFEELLCCIAEGKITKDEIARLKELTGQAVEVLAILSDAVSGIGDGMVGVKACAG